MGLESNRTNDKYDTINGCLGTQLLHLNRRRKPNHIEINGLNGHQQYCGSQTASNISAIKDHQFCSPNYNNLWRVCRERGVLFEDPQFVPSNRLLFGKRESCHNYSKISSHISWMRPFQLVSRPKYINESNMNNGFDLGVGEASNLYPYNQSLLHAISLIYSTPKLLDRVIISHQNFNTNTYSGIFKFKFWKFGEWYEIVIDDRLPTFKGRLLYLHSSDPTEFWPSLLEKAYAKLYGGYEYYLRHCFTAQTTQDLTGGIAQSFTIGNHDGHIIQQMISSAVSRSTILSSCISDGNNSEINSNNKPMRLRNGLITFQSYAITGLSRVRTISINEVQVHQNQNPNQNYMYSLTHTHHNHVQGNNHFIQNNNIPVYNNRVEVQLIRLRNVWGKGEWNGAWSESSFEWDHLCERDREELTLRYRDNGEFWMSIDDFLNHFTHLDIIHIGPDDWMQEMALHHKRPWRAVLARRRWKKGFNAGGGPSYKDTFATNPQFHIQIPKTGANKLHVVVSVTQLYSTNLISSNQESQESQLQNIGFCIYEVPPHTTRLTHAFVANSVPLDVTAFTSTRESVTFFTLPAGDFIIVASTEKPHCETKFLLRLFTDEATKIWEVNDDNIIFADLQIPKVVENVVQNGHNVLSRLITKSPTEVDAFTLYKILKVFGKPMNVHFEKPSLELCRYLIMLKDSTITGKMHVKHITSVLNILHFWRSLFTKHQTGNKNKVYTYNLRVIFYESGLSVSNKVLESILIRYADNSTYITLEAYLLSLVKLHLAHERYKSLERKGKNHNITLEEMILLTIYS